MHLVSHLLTAEVITSQRLYHVWMWHNVNTWALSKELSYGTFEVLWISLELFILLVCYILDTFVRKSMLKFFKSWRRHAFIVKNLGKILATFHQQWTTPYSTRTIHLGIWKKNVIVLINHVVDFPVSYLKSILYFTVIHIINSIGTSSGEIWCNPDSAANSSSNLYVTQIKVSIIITDNNRTISTITTTQFY